MLATEQKKIKGEIGAMNYSMRYKMSKYRNPIDVSAQNLLYDIKSRDSTNTRFIEVKGRAESGDVEITSNEWNKAQVHENNYYLYVVFNANCDYSDLYIVQKPISKLNSSFDSYNKKYVLTQYEIMKHKVLFEQYFNWENYETF